MKYLTLEQVLALHVLAINQFGGSNGIRDLARIESAIASQSQEIFGEELYPSIFEKSAALARNIIGDHPFHDGNKRTAMLTALTFIEINEHIFTMNEGELEDFAVSIAIDHLDIPTIASWLRQHSK